MISEDIIKIAANEVGYREGANNDNKYGVAYGYNNVAWCVQFLWWVFREAGASDLFGKKTASCTTLYNNHKHQEVPKNEIQRGDIVFFDWSGGTETEHVGIVEFRSGDIISTIEGNTGDGNQSNGDGVYSKTRRLTQVSHSFRPAYNNQRLVCSIEMPFLQNGDVCPEVKTLQRLLMSFGYSMSPYGCDGEFGDLTEKRVKEYQKKHSLEIDGKVFTETWTSLLKG